MIELATADDPDVLCLQEVPAWALSRFTAGDVAARPPLGPFVGRVVTDLHHGLLRSAFAGQGNAIQVSPRLTVLDRSRLTLNPRSFRARQGARPRPRPVDAIRLGEGAARRTGRAAARRRRAHAAGVQRPLHELPRPPPPRRGAAARRRSSRPRPPPTGDIVVLAGDFNVTSEESPALRSLATGEWGFTPPGPGIDHVLVRGAAAGPERIWPVADREYGDVVLSDHAPVEVELT